MSKIIFLKTVHQRTLNSCYTTLSRTPSLRRTHPQSHQLSLSLLSSSSKPDSLRPEQSHLSKKDRKNINDYITNRTKISHSPQQVIFVTIRISCSNNHHENLKTNENMLNYSISTSIAYIIFLWWYEAAPSSKQLKISFWKITIHTFCQ